MGLSKGGSEMKSENPKLQETIKNLQKRNSKIKVPYMERLVDEINRETRARRPLILKDHSQTENKRSGGRDTQSRTDSAGGTDSIHAMESSFPLKVKEVVGKFFRIFERRLK